MAGGFGWDGVGPGEKKNVVLFGGYKPNMYETSSDRTLISFAVPLTCSLSRHSEH